MEAWLTEERDARWRWLVLSVREEDQAMDFWLCGDSRHPWHVRYPGKISGEGREAALSLPLSGVFQGFLQSRGNPLLLTHHIEKHMDELRGLLGTATALE